MLRLDWYRENYKEIEFDVHQNVFAGTNSVKATYKGCTLLLGINREDMNLPCENFMKAVEHFLAKDAFYEKTKEQLDDPYSFEASSSCSIKYLLEQLILKNDTKEEMEKIDRSV